MNQGFLIKTMKTAQSNGTERGTGGKLSGERAKSREKGALRRAEADMR